jgi:hypothetical protein
VNDAQPRAVEESDEEWEDASEYDDEKDRENVFGWAFGWVSSTTTSVFYLFVHQADLSHTAGSTGCHY